MNNNLPVYITVFIIHFYYILSFQYINIFVIDVLSNRKLLAMLLRKRSSVVSTAEDGVQALKEIDRSEHLNYFDLVFMDNTMPNMVRNIVLYSVYCIYSYS